MQENIRRMGAGNIETEVFDGTCTDTGLLGKADVVLLDVPCSGPRGRGSNPSSLTKNRTISWFSPRWMVQVL